MTNLPRTIFDSVATHFNCEDIAMSMFVTALRGGKSHLLADLWAITSMVKLYSPSSISTTIGHKFKRHQCVAEFAKELQLFEGKTALRARTLVHNPKTAFEHGVPLGVAVSHPPTSREVELMASVKGFTKSSMETHAWKWQISTMWEAMKNGLILNTVPWEERWGQKRKITSMTAEESWLALGMVHSYLDQEQEKMFKRMIQVLKKKAWWKEKCKFNSNKGKVDKFFALLCLR